MNIHAQTYTDAIQVGIWFAPHHPHPSFEFVIENSMTLTFPFHYFHQKQDCCLSLFSESEKAVEGTDKENIEQEIEIAPTQVWICN